MKREKKAEAFFSGYMYRRREGSNAGKPIWMEKVPINENGF